MSRVVHFEFDVENPERAKKFYTDTFGWKIDKWDGPMDYWLIETGKEGSLGINGAFMKRSERENFKNQTVNTIGVGSIDESLNAIVKNGGKILTPKQLIPGVGYFAYCLDTEGNAFGVIEPIQM